jgi:hypothetical protein
MERAKDVLYVFLNSVLTVHNVMYDSKEFGKANGKVPKSKTLTNTHKIVEKYQNVTTKKRSAHRRASLPDQTFDDDFGMLFEWASHLDEDQLKDYEIS